MMFILGTCIAFNLYFLFNIILYRFFFGTILSLSTFASTLIYLIMIIIRKQKRKKAVHANYKKIFSKN